MICKKCGYGDIRQVKPEKYCENHFMTPRKDMTDEELNKLGCFELFNREILEKNTISRFRYFIRRLMFWKYKKIISDSRYSR